MSKSIPAYWRNIPIYLAFKGSKCKKCGKKYFPPRKYCVECGSKEMEEYDPPKGGKLLAWSIVRNPPREFKEFAPYIIGLIELDDGLKIIAQIADTKVEELQEGMRVRMTVRRVLENGDRGIIRYGYKFVPDTFNEES